MFMKLQVCRSCEGLVWRISKQKILILITVRFLSNNGLVVHLESQQIGQTTGDSDEGQSYRSSHFFFWNFRSLVRFLAYAISCVFAHGFS